jgi:hypothetical protein
MELADAYFPEQKFIAGDAQRITCSWMIACEIFAVGHGHSALQVINYSMCISSLFTPILNTSKTL